MIGTGACGGGFNATIAEEKGADFYSIEKAGVNALKNLAKKMDLDLCK